MTDTASRQYSHHVGAPEGDVQHRCLGVRRGSAGHRVSPSAHHEGHCRVERKVQVIAVFHAAAGHVTLHDDPYDVATTRR
jgi:hypothetical protein